jgi:hypothetical protein
MFLHCRFAHCFCLAKLVDRLNVFVGNKRSLGGVFLTQQGVVQLPLMHETVTSTIMFSPLMILSTGRTIVASLLYLKTKVGTDEIRSGVFIAF